MNDTEFFTFLNERKQAVSAKIQSLAAEDRQDEANILKARFNVYDISKAVFNVAAKQSDKPIETAFSASFEKITSPWRASLEQARTHGDEYKVLIEEAKLAAVDEITACFTSH